MQHKQRYGAHRGVLEAVSGLQHSQSWAMLRYNTILEPKRKNSVGFADSCSIEKNEKNKFFTIYVKIFCHFMITFKRGKDMSSLT